MTGWNLPPGCNVSDIPGNRPEDELADAIADGWRPRCKHCGAFLPIESTEDRIENDALKTWVAFYTCKKCGKETIAEAWPTVDPDSL